MEMEASMEAIERDGVIGKYFVRFGPARDLGIAIPVIESHGRVVSRSGDYYVVEQYDVADPVKVEVRKVRLVRFAEEKVALHDTYQAMRRWYTTIYLPVIREEYMRVAACVAETGAEPPARRARRRATDAR